jgi:transposase
MLHAGLDLSRRRLDVCVISDVGELVDEFPAPPDSDGLRYLVGKVGRHREPVRAVIESMTGARFVHDTLEQLGWDVRIADAQKVKGLAPLACKTDKSAWTAAHPEAMKWYLGPCFVIGRRRSFSPDWRTLGHRPV